MQLEQLKLPNLFCFFPRSFLTAAPRGVRRTREEPARYVQRASATTSTRGGMSAPALGTAVAGSSRRELLKAVLAATVNIWPQRRCKAWAAREWEGEASALPRARARRNVWVAVLQRPPHLERKDYQLAASLLPELRVGATFALLGLRESQARLRISAGAGAAVTLDWTHQGDVNSHLRTVEGWEAVGNDLQASGVSDGQPQV